MGKRSISIAIIFSGFLLIFGVTSTEAQPSERNKPVQIQVYSASGSLTATRNYRYDSNNRIIRIEDLPADGVRNTFSTIRYNAAGKPVFVETFYSGITRDAEGITYQKNIQYSGRYISSIRLTSSAGEEPVTSTYTYFSETRTYEVVTPGLPVYLMQFTPDLNLDRHYTADGAALYDVTHTSAPGPFVFASIPIELSLLFDGARHFYFSKNEITSIPVLYGNSYDIRSIRDEYDRIYSIEAMRAGTEHISFTLRISY